MKEKTLNLVENKLFQAGIKSIVLSVFQLSAALTLTKFKGVLFMGVVTGFVCLFGGIVNLYGAIRGELANGADLRSHPNYPRSQTLAQFAMLWSLGALFDMSMIAVLMVAAYVGNAPEYITLTGLVVTIGAIFADFKEFRVGLKELASRRLNND